MRVLIRADAASHIGEGHVMRCISLAAALKNLGAHVTFITKVFDSQMDIRIKRFGFDVLTMKTDDLNKNLDNHGKYDSWLMESQDSDFARFIKQVGSQKFAWLVLDSYSLDERWERKAKTCCEKLLVIDDLADRRHLCDILLDQNIETPVQKNYSKLVNKSADLLIGTKYCLLQPEFSEVVPRQASLKQCKRLLLFFGGSDQSGLTLTTIQSLQKMRDRDGDRYGISVLVGSNNKSAKEIAGYCAINNIAIYSEVNNMAEFLRNFDLAIAACGFICYELAAMKIPSLLVPVSAIQTEVAKAMEKKGVCLVLYPEEISKLEKLAVYLKRIAATDIRNFNGTPKNGARNVALKMLNYQ